MDSRVAVSVRNLSKSYRVIHSPWQKLKYYLFHRPYGNDFYALKDVSFDIRKGETFGIIGVNGSGKSTLLQVLAGIIPKSGGDVAVDGKISALLELGSGFNPENTGMENIYLNAAILGVRKEDIDKKCDEIVSFADIGDFINEPVKTYSSGMFIRLAFAVAINVNAEIIIIDEALAVGDIFFRQKCYAKLNELKAEGKTIILVSHGMNEVEQFCDRALLLHHGEQIMLGKSGEVVERYYLLNQNIVLPDETKEEIGTKERELASESENIPDNSFFHSQWRITEDRYIDLSLSKEQNNGMAHFIKVGLFDQEGKARSVFRQGEYAYFYYEFMVDKPLLVPINGIIITNDKNIIIHGKNSFQTQLEHVNHVKAGSIVCNCVRVKLDLAWGEYTYELGFSMLPEYTFQHRADMPHEELYKDETILANRRGVGTFFVQGKEGKTPANLSFYGLVDMEDEFDRYIISS